MPMYARHQTYPNGSPYRLGHFALVRGSQGRLVGVLDSAHFRHILGHHAEVL